MATSDDSKQHCQLNYGEDEDNHEDDKEGRLLGILRRFQRLEQQGQHSHHFSGTYHGIDYNERKKIVRILFLDSIDDIVMDEDSQSEIGKETEKGGDIDSLSVMIPVELKEAGDEEEHHHGSTKTGIHLNVRVICIKCKNKLTSQQV